MTRTTWESLGTYWIENEADEDKICNSNLAISETKKSTAPVSLRASDILEATLASRNQQIWEKLFFCSGSDLSAIVKAQLVRRHYVFIE